MRKYSRLAIVVSHDYPDEDGTDAVSMTNGHSSVQVADLESALSILPPGSNVYVVAKGTVGNKTVHRLSRVIRESCAFVSLDLSEVTECARVLDCPFAGNRQLQMIRFPNNLVAINARAFYGCTALESVSIPATCKDIGAGAFLGCEKLSSLVFGGAEGWQAEQGGVLVPAGGLSDETTSPSLFVSPGARYAACRLYKPDAFLSPA